MASQWQAHEPRLEETKRTARLLQIMLMVAAAPHHYTRKDFAKRFDVSTRMISKDMELISNITGFDLQGGRDGYSFTRVPDLPLLHFSVAETLALLNAIGVAKHMSGVDSPNWRQSWRVWRRSFRWSWSACCARPAGLGCRQISASSVRPCWPI
jgi:hypothetical protein